ncbi:MAG: hypothetical protein K6F21_01955 [Bacteroidales bacterium]|nr:hypothetical protein [Bacteroidales bacterium]
MKLYSKILLVAVATVSALAMVSCNKDNGKDEAEATFEAPEYADAAKTVTITDSQNAVSIDGQEVSEFEFTESGYAVITLNKKTKADSENGVIIAPYTYSNGVYTIEGFGTIKIENGKLVVTTNSGNTVTVTATVSESTTPSEGSTEWNLCRAWTLVDFKISVKGGSLGSTGVGKLFTNPKMSVIKAWLVEQKVNIPEDVVLENYDVVDINFTSNGTFFINFSKADPFVGAWDIKSNSFHYELSSGGNYIFNGSADGNISFKKENNIDVCVFTVNGEIVNGNDKYTSEIVLTMKAK